MEGHNAPSGVGRVDACLSHLQAELEASQSSGQIEQVLSGWKQGRVASALMQLMHGHPCLMVTLMAAAAAAAAAQGLLLKEGMLLYHCSGTACMP